MRLFRAACRPALHRILPAVLAMVVPACPTLAAPPPVPVLPTPYLLPTGVVPPLQLRQAIAKAKAGQTVQVCIAGDSTSSTGTVGTPNGVHLTDGLWYSLMRAMQDQNPGVRFAFQNFAVPGTTMGQFTDTSAHDRAVAAGATWYADASRKWYQYVGLRTPCDIVILNWGVNDGWNVGPDLVKATIAATQANGTPGVIWMTSGVANPSVDDRSADQDGFIAVPSLLRAMAALGSAGFTTIPAGYPTSIGLIDVGRFFQMAFLGRDYGDQTSVDASAQLATRTATITPSASYALPETDGDLDLAATFPGALAVPRGIFFTIGSFDGGRYNNPVVYVTPNKQNGVYVNYSAGSTVKFGPVLVPATGRDLAVEIAVKQDFLTIVVNGSVVQRTVIKPTAPFTPRIYVDDGNPGQAVVVTKFVKGVARHYAPVLDEREVYGPAPSDTRAGTTASGSPATGGNGINHPASDGWNFIWGSVIAQSDFGLLRYASSRYALGGLAATGHDRATAYPIYADVDTFTAVANGAGAALPDYPAGEPVTVFNDGAGALAIWPNNDDDRIGTLPPGAAATLGPGAMAEFERDKALHWFQLR